MCHIGTWSTRYCMRTAKKIWRSKMKNKIWFAECQKNDTRQMSLFAECQDGWHLAKNFSFFFKKPLFVECQAGWHSAKNLKN